MIWDFLLLVQGEIILLGKPLHCISFCKFYVIVDFIYFPENESDMNIIGRANELLEILEKAAELKKMKCYDPNTLELKPGKKK